jgi:hypothetical protein
MDLHLLQDPQSTGDQSSGSDSISMQTQITPAVAQAITVYQKLPKSKQMHAVLGSNFYKVILLSLPNFP